jgi:hypothetical protein
MSLIMALRLDPVRLPLASVDFMRTERQRELLQRDPLTS